MLVEDAICSLLWENLEFQWMLIQLLYNLHFLIPRGGYFIQDITSVTE